MLFLMFFIIFISSFDIIIASISIGSNDIKLSIKKILLINGIISTCIIISYFIRKYILYLININLLKTLAVILFITLCILKLISFFKNKTKIINYDLDNNKDLSLKEILILTMSLAIDNMLMCFGSDVVCNYIILFIPIHFIFNTTVFYISNIYSYKLINFSFNLSDLLNSFLFLFLAITNL